jgi:hypothetical protein
MFGKGSCPAVRIKLVDSFAAKLIAVVTWTEKNAVPLSFKKHTREQGRVLLLEAKMTATGSDAYLILKVRAFD